MKLECFSNCVHSFVCRIFKHNNYSTIHILQIYKTKSVVVYCTINHDGNCMFKISLTLTWLLQLKSQIWKVKPLQHSLNRKAEVQAGPHQDVEKWYKFKTMPPNRQESLKDFFLLEIFTLQRMKILQMTSLEISFVFVACQTKLWKKNPTENNEVYDVLNNVTGQFNVLKKTSEGSREEKRRGSLVKKRAEKGRERRNTRHRNKNTVWGQFHSLWKALHYFCITYFMLQPKCYPNKYWTKNSHWTLLYLSTEMSLVACGVGRRASVLSQHRLSWRPKRGGGWALFTDVTRTPCVIMTSHVLNVSPFGPVSTRCASWPSIKTYQNTQNPTVMLPKPSRSFPNSPDLQEGTAEVWILCPQ